MQGYFVHHKEEWLCGALSWVCVIVFRCKVETIADTSHRNFVFIANFNEIAHQYFLNARKNLFNRTIEDCLEFEPKNTSHHSVKTSLMGFALKTILRVYFVVRELRFENDGLVKLKFISYHMVISIG